MKPSRIIKSAWKRAGKPGSLKQFADALDTTEVYELPRAWRRNKAELKKQRASQAREAVRKSNAHTALDIRRNATKAGQVSISRPQENN